MIFSEKRFEVSADFEKNQKFTSALSLEIRENEKYQAQQRLFSVHFEKYE